MSQPLSESMSVCSRLGAKVDDRCAVARDAIISRLRQSREKGRREKKPGWEGTPSSWSRPSRSSSQLP
eukprot:478-Rhodomonas_salina.3